MSKLQCYMIVSPSALNSHGTLDSSTGFKRFCVKFGDGTADAPRYYSNNPDHDSQGNYTARVAKQLEKAVFQDRGFKNVKDSEDPSHSEWYTVWDSKNSNIEHGLPAALDAFSKYNFSTSQGIADCIAKMKELIPQICSSPQ